MSSDGITQIDLDISALKGGLDVLFALREEFAQWVEEAQDDSKHEALENVLAHIETLEGEYRIRQAELGKQRGAV